MSPLWVLLVLVVAAACRPTTDSTAPSPLAPTPIRLTALDATTSGVTHVHDAGFSVERLLPETMGSGVAVFDADGDGLPELAFASLGAVDGPGGGVSLWRNLGGWRFARVDGAIASNRHALGLAIADADGDGRTDLLVTAIDGDQLWLGRAGLRFELAGDGVFQPPSPGFSSSAAFLDLDGGGALDLLIGRYVVWSRTSDLPCWSGSQRVYCTPEAYPPVANVLLLGEGGLRESAGVVVGAALGKALGVVPVDVGGDGRLDLAVACDTEANLLFVAGAEGVVEDGLARGFALGVSGTARGGMGIAAGDLDGDGLEDLAVGNFAREAVGVFLAQPDGSYRDVASQVGLGLATHVPSTFGVVAVDLDLDGHLDLVAANGHIEPTIAVGSGGVESWAQPLQVFRNDGTGRFHEVSGLDVAAVGRGLATGDLDGDGDLDLVVTQNGGPPLLLRNNTEGRSLRVRLEGPPANRLGLGARVVLELADGTRQVRRLEPAGSYLSASEPVVTFGLGGSTVRRLEVHWPDGALSLVEPVAGGVVSRVRHPGSPAGLPSG